MISASQDRNFQIWNLNSFDVPLADKTSIKFSEKIHYTPKTNSIDLKFADTKLEYNIKSWCTIGGGGRFLWFRRDNDWIQEQRPMVFGTLSASINRFDLDFSNRIAYRFLNKADNHFRHWQKFVISFPEISKPKFQFFSAFESFCKLNIEKLHMLRLYAGMNTIQKDHFEMKIYYALQKNKDVPYWITTDIIGINFSIEI